MTEKSPSTLQAKNLQMNKEIFFALIRHSPPRIATADLAKKLNLSNEQTCNICKSLGIKSSQITLNQMNYSRTNMWHLAEWAERERKLILKKAKEGEEKGWLPAKNVQCELEDTRLVVVWLSELIRTHKMVLNQDYKNLNSSNPLISLKWVEENKIFQNEKI